MDEELFRNYDRWRRAEEDGRDEDADALFERVFGAAAAQPAVSPGFAARTMAAVQAAAARDARRARWTRRILLPAAAAIGAAIVYSTAGLIATAATATIVGVLDLLIGAVVGVATGAEAGADFGTVLASLGRATMALLANPRFTMTILAIQGIALAALVTLQRLLRSDREMIR